MKQLLGCDPSSLPPLSTENSDEPDAFTGCLSEMIDHTSHADKMGNTDWWQGKERQMKPGYVTHLIERPAVDFIDRQ